MYDRATDSHKFTGFYYDQHVDGVPVFRSRMMLLVRNILGYPVVLVSADLRPTGAFRVDRDLARGGDAVAAEAVHVRLGEQARIESSRNVVWAGAEDIRVDEPRLAVEVVAEAGSIADPAGYQKMLYIVDAVTGEVLFEESQVVHARVTGTASMRAALETGADVCHDVSLTPLPYARIVNGTTVSYADASGNFTIDADAGDEIVSRVWGRYFRVTNPHLPGQDAVLVQSASPGTPIEFLHNAANESELTRAEVNAYLHANIARDWALSHHPTYPALPNQQQFVINVNLNDTCNAFYNGGSINFFSSGDGCANTAAGTVVYHEFGHHLVNVGGSG